MKTHRVAGSSVKQKNALAFLYWGKEHTLGCWHSSQYTSDSRCNFAWWGVFIFQLSAWSPVIKYCHSGMYVLRVFAEMLIMYKQELEELSSIWLHFSVQCFDMWSPVRGLTLVYSSSVKRGQAITVHKTDLTEALIYWCLWAPCNDTGGCWKQSKLHQYIFKRETIFKIFIESLKGRV